MRITEFGGRLDLLGCFVQHPQVAYQITVVNQRHVVEHERAEGIEDSFGVGKVQDLDRLAHTSLALMWGTVARSAMARDSSEVDAIFDEVRRTLVLVVWSRISQETQAEWLEALAQQSE